MPSLPLRADIAGTPSNATAKAALAAIYDFLAPMNGGLLSSSGYFKLPNGTIVQWTGATTSSAGVTVVWPIAFPNAVLCVTGICRNAAHALWADNTSGTSSFSLYTSSASLTGNFVIGIGY